jgi:hypothetical protein
MNISLLPLSLLLASPVEPSDVNDRNESPMVAASMLRRGGRDFVGECRVLLRGSVSPVSDVEETSRRGFSAGLALQTESVSQAL